MAFMSVASKRAASEVVVEQVGVVRVMLFGGSERGAELIAMMLTSPEDGVAVTSPVANSQFANRSGIGVVAEVLAEVGGPAVDVALAGVVQRERVVEREVTAPGLSSIADLLATSVAEFILGGAFDVAVVEFSQSEIAQVVAAV